MGRPYCHPASTAARMLFSAHAHNHHHIHHHHHSQHHGCLWWRACQLVAMTTALVSLYTCALLYAGVSAARTQQEVQRPRPVTWLQRDQLQLPAETELCDLTDFRYVLRPDDEAACRATIDGSALYFLIYVHSAPDHFQARQTIRQTWGSVRHLATLGIRVVFLLGLTPSESLQSRLVAESATHGDLVQGNFVDSYRNLSYKHLMGHKWALASCWRARYLVKADDDVFVDVRQLATLLDNLYPSTPSSGGVLACSVWPAGSAPQRRPTQKWAVDQREYPYDAYPAYCGGLAYVLSADVAGDLLAASRFVPLFWIDDLYVTGLLAETLPHLRHHALNLRITYDTTVLERWLRERGRRERACPYVFGDVSDGLNRSALMHELWRKTERVWRNDAASSIVTTSTVATAVDRLIDRGRRSVSEPLTALLRRHRQQRPARTKT